VRAPQDQFTKICTGVLEIVPTVSIVSIVPGAMYPAGTRALI
jgi:hypothetical protein